MKYPHATWRPSPIDHPRRPSTRGIVIHWTAGHEAGDLATLTGGSVDVQFYVAKSGRVYQLLDSDSQAWHAFRTANTYCIGIEHEGSGEAWTAPQFRASAALTRWLCDRYSIPVVHVDPHRDWHGIYGHADLKGIDGNDHVDTVPAATGWAPYLAAIRSAVVPPRPRPLTEAQERSLFFAWRREGGHPWARPAALRDRIPKSWWALYPVWLARHPWPVPVPAWYWSWQAWCDGGRKGKRPRAPRVIPMWAWVRYARHRRAGV